MRLLTAFLAAGFELLNLESASPLPRRESIRSVVCEGDILAMVGFASLIEGVARSPRSDPVCKVGVLTELPNDPLALLNDGVEGVDGVYEGVEGAT
jgi:hypothetical protein